MNLNYHLDKMGIFNDQACRQGRSQKQISERARANSLLPHNKLEVVKTVVLRLKFVLYEMMARLAGNRYTSLQDTHCRVALGRERSEQKFYVFASMI